MHDLTNEEVEYKSSVLSDDREHSHHFCWLHYCLFIHFFFRVSSITTLMISYSLQTILPGFRIHSWIMNCVYNGILIKLWRPSPRIRFCVLSLTPINNFISAGMILGIKDYQHCLKSFVQWSSFFAK